MNLAAKYRPKTWEDVTEQGVVVEMLKGICARPELDCRAFLFIGSQGIGKTTLARIMANVLNDNAADPIEIDAASHGGVDSIREIMAQAQQYPIGAKHKVFIIDECFPGDTWISTPSGKIQLKDLREGDHVFNLTGTATVTRVFHNRVKLSNLVSVRVGEKHLITTKDHLFFTDYGWVPAHKLQAGDVLYDFSSLQRMRESIRSDVSERFQGILQQGVPKAEHVEADVRTTPEFVSKRVSSLWSRILDSKECKFNDLFRKVWEYLEIAESRFGETVGTTCKVLAYIYLSRMWKTDGDLEERSSNSMFSEMCKLHSTEIQETSRITKCLSMVWEYICSELQQSAKEDLFRFLQSCLDCEQTERKKVSGIFYKDDKSQSDVQSRNSSKDAENSGESWNSAQSSCIAWWKRKLHEASDDTEGSFRSEVDIRIFCEDRDSEDKFGSLSYQLQTRPSLSGVEVRNRGGWCRPSYEIATVVRREEGKMPSAFRVDGVEIYQPGNNDELFRSCIENSEFDGEYVTFYDLEVHGHPSYFVNDILVHNCHCISSAGWSTALKTIEEVPAKSVFLFATTNPEKIPATILSRVQTFRLSKISLQGIVDRLIHVINCEQSEGRDITYDMDAIGYIAKMANGGMRDALTLLDKALSYSNHISSENISTALGLPDYDDYFSLLQAYAKHDNMVVSKIVDKVYNSGVNFVRWFEGFHSFVINITKYIFLQDIESTMIPPHYRDKVSKYGAPHSVVCLKLANKLLKLNYDLKSTQYLQEVALTYLCQLPKKGE